MRLSTYNAELAVRHPSPKTALTPGPQGEWRGRGFLEKTGLDTASLLASGQAQNTGPGDSAVVPLSESLGPGPPGVEDLCWQNTAKR